METQTYALRLFTLLSTRLKGSTVNMNIMGWVYSKVSDLAGSPGHTALGASLMIGKYHTILLWLGGGGIGASVKGKT